MILTNQWTEYSHGHARTELRLLKSLLSGRGVTSQILSTAHDFGDIQSVVHDLSRFIPSRINRGPFHQKILEYKENQLTKMWAAEVSSDGSNSTLIVSSGFWSLLVLTLKKPIQNKIVFRLISPPELSKIRGSDLELVLNAIGSKRLVLGIETLDGQKYLERNLGIHSLFVPPLSTTAVVLNPSKIGIIWSVTDPITETEICSVLEQFEKRNLIIKLPVGIELSQLKCDISEVETIPNGISDELFATIISRLKTVYLPHRNYNLRGSGLITSMLGSGVSVLVHQGNSFVQDFQFSKLMVVTEMSDLRKNIMNMEKLELDRNLESEKIRVYINKKWEDFLGFKDD